MKSCAAHVATVTLYIHVHACQSQIKILQFDTSHKVEEAVG